MAQVSTMAGQAADDPISQQACGEDEGTPPAEAEKYGEDPPASRHLSGPWEPNSRTSASMEQLVPLQPPQRSLPEQVTGDPALLG